MKRSIRNPGTPSGASHGASRGPSGPSGPSSNTNQVNPRQNNQAQRGPRGNANPLNGVDPSAAGVFENVLHQYGGKSESELIGELQRLRQAGMLNTQSLYDMANTIAPMLNPEQLQRLWQVIQELSK